MQEYHKIQTVFKRNPETNYKTLLYGEYSIPEFEYLANNKWVFTEKVDGTNIRVMFDGEIISFGGKSDRAQIPAFLVNRLNDLLLHKIDLFKELFPDGACLYGEGYGPKIQKGGKYKSTQDFVLFDVKIGDWWIQRSDIEDIADKSNIDIVPIIGTGSLLNMVGLTEIGFKSIWGDFMAEGIVARPEVELKTRSGNRIITKIKHKDFR